MPIDTSTLAALARTYVAAMTSIRGRRVHRLLMREFARFDHVLAVQSEDGGAALLALAADGSAALCRSDGRGAAAEIAAARLDGATVMTAFDLLKDSLPVVRWVIRHPGLARVGGALTITASRLAPAEQQRVAEILRRLAG
jgi:hypothetical protein